MTEVWLNRGNVFWLSLETYEEMGKDKTIY
jgi:hypothetical protein